MSLLFALLAILLLVVALRWFLAHAPRYGRSFLIRIGLILVAILLLALVFSGRLHWLAGLLGGLLPFARRLLPLLRWLPLLRPQNGDRHSPGQQSEVQTRWLRMQLDHDSGTMTGQILGGRYAGRRLHDLELTELRDFYDACRQEDPEAIRLLDAYIQRHCADHWEQQERQEQTRRGGAASGEEMSTEEAWAVLGLEPGASREEILRAHKRMMLRLHPDRGGSNYLAAKINQAKERLLAASE